MADVNNLGHTGFLQRSEVSLWPFQGQRLSSPTAGQKSTSLGGCWYLSLPGQKDLWCQAVLAARKPLVRCGAASRTPHLPSDTPNVQCCGWYPTSTAAWTSAWRLLNWTLSLNFSAWTNYRWFAVWSQFRSACLLSPLNLSCSSAKPGLWDEC